MKGEGNCGEGVVGGVCPKSLLYNTNMFSLAAERERERERERGRENSRVSVCVCVCVC